VRRRQAGLAQGGMQPHKRGRIPGGRDLRSHGLVVRPERDGKTIPRVDTGFGSGLKLSHRGTGSGETAGNLYFQLGVSLMR
jgi:hypothetical protein